MNVTVRNVQFNGTTSIGTGTSEDGQEVVFVGDWRPMRDIAEALLEDDLPPVVAIVPERAILRLGPCSHGVNSDCEHYS